MADIVGIRGILSTLTGDEFENVVGVSREVIWKCIQESLEKKKLLKNLTKQEQLEKTLKWLAQGLKGKIYKRSLLSTSYEGQTKMYFDIYRGEAIKWNDFKLSPLSNSSCVLTENTASGIIYWFFDNFFEYHSETKFIFKDNRNTIGENPNWQDLTTLDTYLSSKGLKFDPKQFILKKVFSSEIENLFYIEINHYIDEQMYNLYKNSSSPEEQLKNENQILYSLGPFMLEFIKLKKLINC